MLRELRLTLAAAGLFAAGLLPGLAPALAQEGLPDLPGPNLVIEIAGTANGTVVIDLLPDTAPRHVEQITTLARQGAYDGVVFHRVIEGFMAQTGDVKFGKTGGDTRMAGMGGSDLPNIPAEFSNISFQRGIVGMARSNDPNSANSQFFIMFADGAFLDGQYTVVGRVISGLDVVDRIQRGEPPATPDVMVKVTVTE
ncbi:peptidylprolyl isomerase [Pseudogemmobacter sonorensis]|uniref:peptidylprolyl isomerase n=1 Tax=Pseudogemmobacter sonorensis TaxID=2989681 RepID=UPI003694E375